MSDNHKQLVRCPCGKSWLPADVLDREYCGLVSQNESLRRQLEKERRVFEQQISDLHQRLTLAGHGGMQ